MSLKWLAAGCVMWTAWVVGLLAARVDEVTFAVLVLGPVGAYVWWDDRA